MFAKLGAQLVKELIILLPQLAYKAFLALREYLEQRRKEKANREAAKRVQDAKSPEDIRAAADNLP